MKAPKCRTCGDRHRLGPCPDSGRPTDKAKAREPEDGAGGDADLPQPLKASRGGKRVVEPAAPFANAPSSSGRTAGLGPANGGSNPPGATNAPERLQSDPDVEAACDAAVRAGRMREERDWVSGGPENPVHTFAEAERIAEAYRESSSPLEDAPVSGDGESHERAYRVESPLDPETSAGLAPSPLTPAEKQKAYRERHADEVRKRDRERKAAKRQEAKDG